jgi:hypothetical protein
MVEPGSRFVSWLLASLAITALGVEAGCGFGHQSTSVGSESLTRRERRSSWPAGTSGFIWGVQGHPGKQAAYASSGPGLARQFDYLDSLGATHYRIDVYPDTGGRVDPAFDGIVQTAAARGIELLPVLAAHPDWNAAESANYRRGYAMGYNFAARYRGRFSHVEAGNELDNQVLGFGVDSTANPPSRTYQEGSLLTHYVDTLLSKTTSFLRGLTDGLHRGAPGTRVIIDAGWRHYGFFQALHRDSVAFDVYGYHWYSEMGDFAAEVLPHLPDPNKEIWITEANRRNTGERYNDPAEQAGWIARFAGEVSAIPRVKALFVYELYEERAFGETEGESYYGIVGCSDPTCTGPQTLKPGFHAYRDAIRGSLFAGRSRGVGDPIPQSP